MHAYLQYGILENLDAVRRIQIGRLWGVQLLATPVAWLSPIVFFGLHLVLGLLNPAPSLSERLYRALLFVIAVEVSTLLHAAGHIVSGKLARSAMDALLITATRDVNVYHGDQSVVPARVHLARAAGGPVMNLVAAGLCAIVALDTTPGLGADLLASMLSTNLVFGIGGLMPLPSVDGWIIWREILRLIRA